MKKRIIAATFAVTLTAFLMLFNTSAMVYDDIGEEGSLVPALDCTYTFNIDNSGTLTANAPTLGDLASTSVVSTVAGQSDELVDFMYFQSDYDNDKAGFRFDFADSLVSGSPADVTSLTVDYEPFTIHIDKLIKSTTDGNKLPKYDGMPLFENIGANMNWAGNTATVDAYVEFDLHYVDRRLVDLYHGIYEYQTYSKTYAMTVHMENVVDDFGAPDIPISAISIIDVASGQSFQSFAAFKVDFNEKNAIVLSYYGFAGKRAYFVDVRTLTIDVAFNDPVSSIGFTDVPYYDQGLYADINSSAYYFKNDVPQFRQQLYSSYLAHNAAANLNRQEISTALLAGAEGSDNPLVRVPALFLSAVGDFFSIDFFGMGFTLGHLTFVIALAAVVLIFLKMFAGG